MNFKICLFILLNILKVSSKKLLNKQKKFINLSFSIDNDYSDYLFIPLLSLLEKGYKNTIYYIYILVGEDFELINKNKLYYF